MQIKSILKLSRLNIPLLLGQLIISSFLVGILGETQFQAKAQSTTPIQGEEAKARESVGILIRAYQTYYEQNQKIPTEFSVLNVKGQVTPGYVVGIVILDPEPESALVYAKPYKSGLKGYIGGIFVTQEKAAIAGICEATEPGFPPGFPRVVSEVKSIECPAGYQLLTP